MGWGIVCLRGEVPNTSETCCAFRRPHLSAIFAAPRTITVCSASLASIGGEGRGEWASSARRDTLPCVLHLSRNRASSTHRLTRIPGKLGTLSNEVDPLSWNVSPLTDDLGTVSDAIDALSGPIDAISPHINPISDDIFGLTGDIFGLSGGTTPQFHLSKPLTQSKLEPKRHPALCQPS